MLNCSRLPSISSKRTIQTDGSSKIFCSYKQGSWRSQEVYHSFYKKISFFIPSQYTLDTSGNPSGFAIEVLEQIAQIATLQVHSVVKEDWTEMFETLNSGEVDLIPNKGREDLQLRIFDHVQDALKIICIFYLLTH